MTSPPNYFNPPPPQSSDPGLFYLWSPLMIFAVALACVVGLVIIGVLLCMIYNYCTYGMCCCPGTSCGASCCFDAPTAPTKVIRRRRVSVNDDSVRIRTPRRQSIVTIDEPPCDDQVVVVRRPSMDRKVVRIVDTPSIRSVRVRRPEICIIPQELPQPQIIMPSCQPSTIRPITTECCPQPQPYNGGFQGGELRVVIGNAQQQTNRSNRVVYNMNQAPSVSCQFERNQPNEYVLTSVEGNGGGGMNKGWDQDCGSCYSDGQRSAVIDIGHGVRNSFYPTLPHYDN